MRKMASLDGAGGQFGFGGDGRGGLFQRVMRGGRRDRKKIAHALLRPINPELTLADSVVDDLLAVGAFRLTEKRNRLINK